MNSFIRNTPFPNNYLDELLLFEKGKGVYLEDAAGKKYLDFGAGIGVNAAGYGREDIAEIVYSQMKKLVHISNLYASKPEVELGKKLVNTGKFSAVHFGNSGSEANEAAIKYSRLYSLRTRGRGNHRILCFKGGFHGRTAGALSCTPKALYQEPFLPLLPGIDVSEYNNADKLEKILDKTYAAVIVEVIQGEGGLRAMEPEFANALNKICRKNDIVLIADEVQTGLGRTGYLYASEAVGLTPDIITLSKALAGGLPLSATLIPERINRLIRPGEHGTTFGGGPVTTAAGSYVFDMLTEKSFLKEVREKGLFLKSLLEDLKTKYGIIKEIRGAGLLTGIVIDAPDKKGILAEIISFAVKKGLLLLRSGTDVIRIAPPLIITEEEIRRGIEIVNDIFKEIRI